MTNRFLLLNIIMILLGFGLYILLITGNMASSISVLLAELGSLAIFIGSVALLSSMHDEK